MKSLSSALGVLLLVAGCTNNSAARSVPPIARTESSSAPLVLTWTELERTSNSASVRLDVDKRAPVEKDVTVSLAPPAGVSLEPPSMTWTIPAGSIGATSRTFRLQWVESPPEDLTAVADAQGVASGVRAVATYRFGRAQARAPEPPRGPPAQVGEKSIGSPIDLSRQ